MDPVIGPIVLGVFISIIGIFNMRGDISSVHWYHRQRVTEEDKIHFGKKVGLGAIIIGVSVIIFGVLSLATELLKMDVFTIIGSVIVVIGIVAGLPLILYAMIKYNKGIF